MNSGIMRGLGDEPDAPDLPVHRLCHQYCAGSGVCAGVLLGRVRRGPGHHSGQICSWVFGIFYINRKYPFLHIRLFRMRLDRRLLGR